MKQENDLNRTASELTAYAAQRMVDLEQNRWGSAFRQPETRHEWVRDILRGMAEVFGGDGGPLLQAFDQRLEDAHGRVAVETLDRPGRKHLVKALSRYAAELERCGGDQRRHVANVLDLLEDMSVYLPWRSDEIGLCSARDQVEGELLRMTARMPIRFTRIIMGGDAGPHWASGFAPGAVTDAGALKRTAVYQEAVRDFPEVKSWPAICTVYLGRGLRFESEAVDATAFDLEIMNRAGDRFLDQRGVRWTCGFYQMTVSAGPEESQAMDAEHLPEMLVQPQDEPGPLEMGPTM